MMNYRLSKGTIAATDVKPMKSFGWSQPLQKLLSNYTAPSPHHAFVCVAIREKRHWICHGYSLQHLKIDQEVMWLSLAFALLGYLLGERPKFMLPGFDIATVRICP